MFVTERISDAPESRDDSVPEPCIPTAPDPLTNLPGRDTFCREVEAGIDAGRASGRRVAVLLLGVNDFKDVNSGFGHEAGDTILVHLAARMASFLSSGCCIARAGGDVFAVLAPLLRTEPEPVQDLVSQLAAVLAEPFAVADGVQVQLSASIGVAVSSADAASAAVLLRNAEIAMYRAKSERQAWARYDAALDGQATDRLLYVAQLREAIAMGQMEVHYQPVVDMRTGQPTSMEALVRWRHPVRGLVSPEEFVGLAEQHGLISELTEFVVSTVAEQTRVWEGAGRCLPCAINVSVQCLVDPGCSERLVTALTALAGAVTVEVTESVFADERAVTVLERLAAGGVPCAIDDFGTGYSCLASLKDLPATTVKIDRSFVTDIEVDDRSFAVVEAILELAKALGLDVIAEGIQTAAAAARLREAGVISAQGFWFARPMPAGEFDTWLACRPRPAGAAAEGGHVSQDGDSHGDHVAFSFDDDKELLGELTGYVSENLSGQGHSVVIAPAAHRRALRLAPAMAQVGALWESAVWSVVDEHIATGLAEAGLSAAAAEYAAAQDHGEVVVACVEGDWHSLPSRMVAEVLVAHGWSVRFLGASHPTTLLVDHLARHRPEAVLLSCAVPMALPALVVAVQAVHQLDLPVYVGGRALGGTSRRGLAIGADGWAPNAAGAAEVLTRPARHREHRDLTSKLSPYRARQVLQPLWAQDAMDELTELMPAVATFTPAVRDRRSADLLHLLDVACIALLLSDLTLMDEQCAWLARVLAARGVSPDELAHGLTALRQAQPPHEHAVGIDAVLRHAQHHLANARSDPLRSTAR